jgi:FkbM family methyltransferase
MPKIILTALYFFLKLLKSVRYLGTVNTLKIFFLNTKEVNIKIFKNKFYFRPKIDQSNYLRFVNSHYAVFDNKKDKIIYAIDVGANIGSQAVRFLNINKNIKKIICIEPDNENFALCKKNLTNYPAVFYNNSIHYKNNISLNLYKNCNSEMSETKNLLINKKTLIQKTKSLNLNTIIKREKINRIDFIKIDTNGFENIIFKKNLQWLKITNCLAFNNADINSDSYKIINSFKKAVGPIKIFNIDQMIILVKKKLKWEVKKVFIHTQKPNSKFDIDFRL